MSVSLRLFAILREMRGTSQLDVELLEGESVAQLFDRLFASDEPGYPRESVMFAVNQDYVSGGHIPEDGDEIAFIPPLAGGAADPRVDLSDKPISLDDLVSEVSGPDRGGLVTFTGTVRNHFEGRPVLHLEYEAYEEMALREMSRLCDEIEVTWPGVAVAMAHRIGRLQIGEAAVHIAIAGGHRAESFAACRHAIDRLKERVPIFKKEVYEDDSTWKSN
jgi:molybdopterin synthase catalytic subunit